MRGMDQDKSYYQLELREDALGRDYTPEEKAMLRPIAEVLALLDGNAFFGMLLDDNREWYEQYLPEAWSVFENNGGINGWAGEMSWIKDMTNDSPVVIEARTALRIALSLSRD